MFLRRLIYFVLSFSLVGVLTVGGILYWLIALAPNDEIKPGNIRKILAVESPVYYRDGITRLGVFFQDEHRQYVSFDQIPQNFVNALVAAEDDKFFSHFGVDVTGIIRAMISNLKAGRVVQGGSTITQQAAKNLFKRRSRSVEAKLKELLYAWRLEYYYSKEEIFEFYANQFYVAGNGLGLAMAARYFFDKPVTELDLVECAFIAGSVKRPNYYNPFIKKDEASSKLAKERAAERTRYVLRRMHELGRINDETYTAAVGRELVFNRGKMRFAVNTVMDQVKQALSDPVVEEVLSLHGIENVATSGVKIVTTVDRGLQQSSLQSLRKELSRLDVRLSGYDRLAVQAALKGKNAAAFEPVPGAFGFGRVLEIHYKGNEPGIYVSLSPDPETGAVGYIDRQGLMNILDPLVKHQRSRWTEAGNADFGLLLKQLAIGDLVWVSVRGPGQDGGPVLLDLEKYPTLQGAALVLKDGVVRAMVGGVEDLFYNRAVSAKRPVGSVFKPIVYAAAMQLGWSNIDQLHNNRDVFVYHDQVYFPRPDHKSPHDRVSMSWAGVTSENVASVWLLYNLCDKLTPAQFQNVTEYLGLAKGADESYAAYQRRIRDRYGVVVDRQTLYEAAFTLAVQAMEADLVFDGRIHEYEVMRTLHYFLDLEQFQKEVMETSEYDDQEPTEAEKEELALREKIMGRSYVALQEGRRQLGEMRATIEVGQLPGLTRLYVDPFGAGDGGVRCAFFQKGVQDGSWRMLAPEELASALGGMEAGDRDRFWRNILVEGMLPVDLLARLENAVDEEYARLRQKPAYDPEVLASIRDFRVMTGIHYVIGLCRMLGIESPLEPVLSLPLGSNVISLFEAAKAYEGLMSSEVHVRAGKESGPALYLIDRIEDSDGEVIFRPKDVSRRVLSPQVSLAVNDILRNVVRFGTGRPAESSIRLHSVDPDKEKYLAEMNLGVPVFGKTGTANRFTNATFLGFVPAPATDGVLEAQRGYVVASYVGYDDNSPMKYKGTRITGSQGALPVWIGIANSLLVEEDFAATVDPAEYLFSGSSQMQFRQPLIGQLRVGVDRNQGGLPRGSSSATLLLGQAEGEDATVMTFGSVNERGEVEPARFFVPYWQSRQY